MNQAKNDKITYRIFSINTTAFIAFNMLDSAAFVGGRHLFQGDVYSIKRILLRTRGNIIYTDITAQLF